MGKHWGIKSIAHVAVRQTYEVVFENLVSGVEIMALIPDTGLYESDQHKKWQPDMTDPKKDPILKEIKKAIDKATP